MSFCASTNNRSPQSYKGHSTSCLHSLLNAGLLLPMALALTSIFFLCLAKCVHLFDGIYPPLWNVPPFNPTTWPMLDGPRRLDTLPHLNGPMDWGIPPENTRYPPSSDLGHSWSTYTFDEPTKLDSALPSTTTVKTDDFHITDSLANFTPAPSWLNYKRTSTSSFATPTASPLVKADEPTTTQQSILGLFNIVRFNHFSCEAGNLQNGSCFTARECRARGGISSRPCAMGFGVCCLFNVTCGADITSNSTYFVNPRYPLAFSGDGSCAVNIPKPGRDICQLRLDFSEFDIRRPHNGDCNSDRLVISGQNANNMIPPLCGLNNGQHAYIDIDMAQGPVQLNFLTSGPGPRLWNIRVSQIQCTANYRAPTNCLQYFTGVKGSFRSFNYDHMSIPVEEGYLNNLDYMTCIRKEAGFCSVAYTNGDLPGQFQFSIANVDRIGMPILPPDVSGAGIRDCPDDYINLNGIPLCGERLNSDTLLTNQPIDRPVVVCKTYNCRARKSRNMDCESGFEAEDSTPGQFMVRFHTNQGITSRGYNLTYQQQPCGAVTFVG